jgi:hypothetical protein
MERILEIIKTRMFLISLASSLGVVLIIFAIIFFATLPSPTQETFAQRDSFNRVLHIPIPDGWEYDEYEGDPYPMLPSALTGLRICENAAAQRPVAVVINNIRQAHPHSGLVSADIVYEVLAEGDVTRLVAIFQSYFPEKIGSVRSARDYFVDFAFNHDAIFVHHGGSPSSGERIRSTGITAMDGGRLEGQGIFWRDRSFPTHDWVRNTGTRSMEHSSYTGREQIERHMEAADIRNFLSADPAYGFLFTPRPDDILKLGDATRVVVPFSPNYTRTFIFDEEKNMYLAEAPTGATRDAETEQQAAATNILIQFTSMNVIAGDAEGRRNVRTVGEGRGYLITGGEFFPVLWQKDSHSAPTRWTFENGTPLTLTPGKTWICVFTAAGTVTFDASS